VRAGEKRIFTAHGKIAALVVGGNRPVAEGVRVVAAHVDAVRIDLKPNPVYQDANLGLLQTHYYGGIKPYQWLSVPLELRGVVVEPDGRTIEVRVGDEPTDPVMVIPDLLVHLSSHADRREGEQVQAESLDAIAGHVPSARGTSADRFRQSVLDALKSQYDVDPEDLASAELSLVPAGGARDVGLDRGLVGGYGQDDRACSYAALRAILDVGTPEHTAIVWLVDKEEIGSTGNTGARSTFLSTVVARLLAAQGRRTEHDLREALARSEALSADVTNAAHPQYPETIERRNAFFLGSGVAMDQSGVHAEFRRRVWDLLRAERVPFQTGEWARVTDSRSEYGTVLPYLTELGMNAMDLSIPLLSMHAPFEVVSKVDLHAGYRAYKAFLER
jgi:aspartyl aminopeptidase